MPVQDYIITVFYYKGIRVLNKVIAYKEVVVGNAVEERWLDPALRHEPAAEAHRPDSRPPRRPCLRQRPPGAGGLEEEPGRAEDEEENRESHGGAGDN